MRVIFECTLFIWIVAYLFREVYWVIPLKRIGTPLIGPDLNYVHDCVQFVNPFNFFFSTCVHRTEPCIYYDAFKTVQSVSEQIKVFDHRGECGFFFDGEFVLSEILAKTGVCFPSIVEFKAENVVYYVGAIVKKN